MCGRRELGKAVLSSGVSFSISALVYWSCTSFQSPTAKIRRKENRLIWKVRLQISAIAHAICGAHNLDIALDHDEYTDTMMISLPALRKSTTEKMCRQDPWRRRSISYYMVSTNLTTGLRQTLKNTCQKNCC